MVFAELGGFFVFVYGLFYILVFKVMRTLAQNEFVKRVFYLTHAPIVDDKLTGQSVERREEDPPAPSLFDYLTCRARLFLKRLQFSKESLRRKLDLVRFIHRQKFIEIALRGLLSEPQRKECEEFTRGVFENPLNTSDSEAENLY